MKKQNILKSKMIILFFTLLLSSCGLMKKFKSSEPPTESKTSENTLSESVNDSNADDIFAKTMNDTSESALSTNTDAPSNLDYGATNTNQQNSDSLPSDFSIKSAGDTLANKEQHQNIEITTDNLNSDEIESSGKIKEYKVKKGETLMQIAFKLYGNISKWKELKKLNQNKLTSNSSLSTNLKLKYYKPKREFVWNPEGTPYLIKTGETLGTISNSVYQTPKKWKRLWENNKPLIKNPNVIYAGFTLYYTENKMANYIEPIKSPEVEAEVAAQEQPEQETVVPETVKAETIDQLSNQTQSAIEREKNELINDDQKLVEEIKIDEAYDQELQP